MRVVSIEEPHNNRQRVLDALRRDKPESRAALARSLGLSKATLSVIADEALDAGWIVESESPAGGIGRRPTLLSLAPALGMTAAVDIHADSLSIQVSNLRGEPLAELTRVTPDSAESLQRLVLNELDAACAGCNRLPDSLRAVALSLPAAIDARGRLNAVGEPAFLAQINWHDAVAARFPGALVRLANNSNAASLAEHFEGAAADWSSFAYLGIGQSGVGAGLVLDGKVYSGRRHGAGEIGALVLGDGEQNLDSLVRLPRTEAFYRRLAQLMALMNHLLDLDGIVLHTVDLDHATWAGQLPAILDRYALRPVTLRPAALGSRAPLAGAARLAGDAAWADLLEQV